MQNLRASTITRSVFQIFTITQSLKASDTISSTKSKFLFLYIATPPLGFLDSMTFERPSGHFVQIPRCGLQMITRSSSLNKLSTSGLEHFSFIPLMFHIKVSKRTR